MRDYSKISPQFWLCDIGRKLRTIGPEAQLVALYLMSSPHSTMTGIYYIPYLLIAHETGLAEEKVQAVMQQLIDCGFCSYDKTYEFVWVHEMARCQIAPQLKPNDNRVKTVNKFLAQLPKLNFIDTFYHTYQEDFHLRKTNEAVNQNPTQMFSESNPPTPILTIVPKKEVVKPLDERVNPSLADEPLSQPIKEQNETESFSLPAGISPSIWIAAQSIFEQWKRLSHQPDATLSNELLTAIQRVLTNGFSEQHIIQACQVCLTRNPQATDFELLHILSQRALFEEALGLPPQPKPMSEMAYQFLDSINGARYGAETSSEL